MDDHVMQYVCEWWEEVAEALKAKGWRWPGQPDPLDVLEKNGWYVHGALAVADMVEVVRDELEDPTADDTLPLGEVLALVTVANRELGAEATIEVPNDPDIAANAIDQAVQDGFLDVEEYRLARL